MKNSIFKYLPILLSLSLLVAGPAWGQAKHQADARISQMLIDSYDLLQEGKLTQAQEIYRRVLQQDPGNPLALNNLGAIMVKEKKYDQALSYLEKALGRAQDYKVQVNQVCDVEGLCLAFRPAQEVYGDRDLTPLIRLNIDLIKTKLAGEKK